MRTTTRALGWIVLGTVAAFGCGGGGTSGSGTGGSGTGTGGGNGGSGVAGTSAGGSGGGAGTSGAAGAAGGSAGAAGGGVAGTGGGAGTTGGGGRGGTTGSGGTGGATGGSAGGTAGANGGGGAGGRGGAGGGGTAGASGTGGGSAGRGGTGGGAGRGGSGGTGGSTASCAGRAVSLSSNGTGTTADTAYAHVEVDLGSDLPIGNTQRTIEFWAFIKTTDWVGETNEVYYYGTSANNSSFGLDFGTNTVTGMSNNHATLNPFTGSMGFTVDSTADLGITSSTDQWVHIAMVWNGTNVITYVNGLPKITAPGTSGATMLATGQSVLTIGCNPSNTNCFNGLFDEFRVWRVARTATEIHDSYNKPVVGNETGLVGYWKFDEPSGTTTADAVTAGGHTAHAGTLRANTTAVPTFVTPPVPLPLVCP